MTIGLDHAVFAYGDTPVLRDVSFSLPTTGAVCLFGASGCGKTTILRLLAGLEQPQSGRICGMDGKRLSVVFQENRLLPWRSVLENVALPLGDTPQARATAQDCLSAVGLAEHADKLPGALSGGMKRRVAIARAMAWDGDILLLDEPFAGLDEPLWSGIAATLLTRFAGRPILLITHIEEEAAALGAPLIRLPPQAPLSGVLA